jgi:hydroxymethylpyrimidine/phosphomethylpyrimidine kinase
MPTALTIAGSDSGGGAGIQADLKTFAALGVYGTSALTAVTAQNTVSVSRVFDLPPEIVAAQIDAVASDIGIDAAKTGMLSSPAIVEVVSAAVTRWRVRHLVVDPVMVAKSGDLLLREEAVTSLRQHLLPLAAVLTPNRPEAEVLVGRSIRTTGEARDAARALHDAGARAVVIKGGHFEGPILVNLLFDGRAFHEFATERIETRHTHGTGCTFAAALAAHLAWGRPLVEATERATQYVAGAVAHGLPIGRGHGPLDHFWEFKKWGAGR